LFVPPVQSFVTARASLAVAATASMAVRRISRRARTESEAADGETSMKGFSERGRAGVRVVPAAEASIEGNRTPASVQS
jgi:hypothetical protein